VNTTQISAPRFAFPSELTEPSVALASLNEKAEPARPEGSAAQQAAQQANSRIHHGQLDGPAGISCRCQIYGRANFGESQGKWICATSSA